LNWRDKVASAEKLPTSYPRFQPFVYSLDSFLPIINLQQEDFWQPVPRWLQYYYWFHVGVGWMATTLIVGAFAGLQRRI
jgi:hypothetical protein